MVVLRAIVVGMEGVFREVRLRALEESPWAFGATFEREIAMTEGEWVERVRQRDGVRAVGYLAFEGEGGGEACGIVGGYLDEGGAKVVHLVSMWVAPAWRRSGVGKMLVEEVVAWAKGRGAERVCLMVTSCNEGAMRFYEGLGFLRTGKTEPYANDAQWEMVRAIKEA